MDKVKEFQGQLLRYFKFGNSEEDAKLKVKILAQDFEFLGIPIRDNIDSIHSNTTAYTTLMQFSDLGFIREIREHVDVIKIKNEEFKDNNINKADFTAQYLKHLEGTFGSMLIARDRLKTLSEQMKRLSCPIGDYLNGYVIESTRLNKLMICSSMGIVSKIFENVDAIKQTKE